MIAFRQESAAGRPWHRVDGYASGPAGDPPHRVDEKHRNVKERGEREPSARKRVGPHSPLAIARADRPAVRPMLDVHLQNEPTPCNLDKSLLISEKGRERLDVINNILD